MLLLVSMILVIVLTGFRNEYIKHQDLFEQMNRSTDEAEHYEMVDTYPIGTAPIFNTITSLSGSYAAQLASVVGRSTNKVELGELVLKIPNWLGLSMATLADPLTKLLNAARRCIMFK